MKYDKIADSLTPRQIAEAFNDYECVALARARVELLEIYLYNYKYQFHDIDQNPTYDATTRMLLKKIVKSYMLQDKEFKQYESLKKYLEIIDSKYRGGVVLGMEDASSDDFPKAKETLDIDAAKSSPILEQYQFEKLRLGKYRSTAICPFHNEKTPSFIIYHENNSYHCFSCGAGGDVIKFIMEIDGLDFIHAVKKLGG